MRILGLDFGSKTVGVAVTDPLGITAQGVEIIRREKETHMRPTFRRIGEKTKIIRIAIYTALAVIPVLGAFLPKSQFNYFCMGLGNIWLGFFMFYAGFVILCIPIFRIVMKKKGSVDNSFVGMAFQFAFLAASVIFIYGLIHAQQPKLVTYDIELANEAAKGRELKIVLLANLFQQKQAMVLIHQRWDQKWAWLML